MKKKREAENLNQVMKIQQYLTGNFDNLCEPYRRYVRRGYLHELIKKGKDEKIFFFLFNDILVATKA